MTPMSSNPYAAPKASFEAGAPSVHEHDQCWREGDILIASSDAHLPPRCVKCNKPARMDSPRAYLWHHPGWYVLIPILVYMVVCLFVRKRAVVVLGLCDEHRRRRRNMAIAAPILGVLGIIGLLGSLGLRSPWLAFFAAVLLVIGAVLAVRSTRLLQPVGITEHEIHLKGCGPAFLDSLPTR
ncbi:hypothetical protein RBA41_16670 [Massilia sp. CCM 9210]|uniref:hypothetical protein n=1 Tax=Massilia scottii TaxID=3057166 RepID=UPI0027965C2A|nr:hypothetical protein [Massilia sp. CCM 9210]MDQ1814943.1 hypothetical protein [Massilia sp. CCM 9210]